MIHMLALLRTDHQIQRRVRVDRHVGEEPAEQNALADHPVIESLGADLVDILAGVAAGNTKRQLVVAQDLHRVADLLENALAAACIGALFVALDADGRDKVAHAQHILGELVVDQRAIGEAQEHTVGVVLADLNDVILAHERLAAGVNIHIRAHGRTLVDDVVDLIKAQVELVAVGRRPAARAVQVAAGSRIQQDCPRHIAAILFADFGLLLAADQGCAHDEAGKEALDHLVVHRVQHAHDELIPVALRIVERRMECMARAEEGVVLIDLVDHIHQLGKILFRILRQITNCFFDTKFLKLFFHAKLCHILVPSTIHIFYMPGMPGMYERQAPQKLRLPFRDAFDAWRSRPAKTAEPRPKTGSGRYSLRFFKASFRIPRGAPPAFSWLASGFSRRSSWPLPSGPSPRRSLPESRQRSA